MGDLFNSPELVSSSNLSSQQQSLHPLLSSYFKQFLQDNGNGPSPEIASLQSRLLSSGGAQSQQMAQDIWKKGFLDPVLNSFDSSIAPRINSQFSGIGGTLSSRRTKDLGDTLGNLTTQASGQFAQMTPQIMAFPLQQTLGQIQGLGSLQQQRLAPISQALQFALTGTQQTQQSPGGPGWGLLNSGISAAGFALGGLI